MRCATDTTLHAVCGNVTFNAGVKTNWFSYQCGQKFQGKPDWISAWKKGGRPGYLTKAIILNPD